MLSTRQQSLVAALLVSWSEWRLGGIVVLAPVNGRVTDPRLVALAQSCLQGRSVNNYLRGYSIEPTSEGIIGLVYSRYAALRREFESLLPEQGRRDLSPVAKVPILL